MLGLQEAVDNANYLSALNEDQICTDIARNLPKYTDPRCQRIEEKLKAKNYISFDRIFNEPTGYYFLRTFLEDHPKFKADYLLFLKDVDAYSQMRFENARFKVGGLMFHRYFSQKEEPEMIEVSDDEDDDPKQEKPKKMKVVENPFMKMSVFEAIKKRNTEKRLRLPKSAAQTPRRMGSDTDLSNHRRAASDFKLNEKSADSSLTDSERKTERIKDISYSPRYSISEFRVAVNDVFTLGQENTLGLYGPSAQSIAEQLTDGEAHNDLFNGCAQEIRELVLKEVFFEFLQSDQYKTYVRTKVLEEQKMGPEDFKCLRVLGKGGFGTVYACRKIDSGKLYAMKAINKKLIKFKKAVAMTMLERHTLSLVHSRFVCGLSYAFQDEQHLFLVMDLMTGGDLKFHLTRSKSRPASPRNERPDHQRSRSMGGGGAQIMGFSEERTRFHSAEILLGLEAMHAKNIIFRDLKLENVLLDNEGHCRISDLGLCALYGKKKVSHYAGTPGYIAPEVAQKKPYGPAVDIFSFGVTIYRMLSGKKPFKGVTRQDFDRAVCTEEPIYDPDVFSNEAIALIKGLLEKDPKKRLGCGKGKYGIQAIKDHEFFKTIDWGLLEVGYLDPPFIPSRHDINANNVQDVENEEEAKQFDKMALDDKFKKQIQGFDYVSKHSVRKEIVAAQEKLRDEEIARAKAAAAASHGKKKKNNNNNNNNSNHASAAKNNGDQTQCCTIL